MFFLFLFLNIYVVDFGRLALAAHGFSRVVLSESYSSCSAWASHCCGFSHGAQAPGT